MNTRLTIKLICLGGAAFLAPFVSNQNGDWRANLMVGLISLFTTVNGFLDKGMANLENERKAQSEYSAAWAEEMDEQEEDQ